MLHTVCMGRGRFMCLHYSITLELRITRFIWIATLRPGFRCMYILTKKLKAAILSIASIETLSDLIVGFNKQLLAVCIIPYRLASLSANFPEWWTLSFSRNFPSVEIHNHYHITIGAKFTGVVCVTSTCILSIVYRRIWEWYNIYDPSTCSTYMQIILFIHLGHVPRSIYAMY